MSILGQFQFRRDVATAWASVNPVLLDGEMGIESDTDKFKIGDGTTPWNGLPYGGIKGDTGATGAMGDKGWSPVLANVTDGERRVLRLIDWTGGTGTKPAVPTDNYIGPTGFTNLAGATDIRGATGATGATGPQGPAAIAFRSITGDTGTATADVPDDTIAITGGTGISTAATDTPDGLVITNTGVTQFNGRTGNVTPQQADYDQFFTTPAEAASAAPVQSVNGQTGNVTVAAGTNNTAVTRTAPTASASTALTTIQSYPVAAGEITAGSEYEFFASLRVINTTTATNAVITLSVGATNVLVLTQAIGATAAAAPGAAVDIYGRITFYSTTQAEAIIRASKQAAVAFDAVANTSASITVSAAGATTIDLKFNTSGATSTFIARIASIQRIK